MARDADDATPISSRRELVEWLESGLKNPSSRLKVGTEHEKIGFYKETRAPVPYENGGIRALIEGLEASLGWTAIFDRDQPIGLYDPEGGAAISIEPGGQFELSGAPLDSLHDTKVELDAHFRAVAAIAQPLGVSFLDLGASPKWSRAETPVMPKQRYQIMSAYMPKVGALGLDMMFRTATIQANLDFTSEADMVRKYRAALALQPVVTALFANSPFMDGKPTGALSQRSIIWRDTDAARTGMLPFVFEDGMGFERYVDYALDVPMYFVKRAGVYHDVAGASFRDLLAGRLPQLPGERATISDWANHLSTIFPEARLKTYLEMRGADGGPAEHILALPALFVGLFYDATALDGALELASGWTGEEREELRAVVPFQALQSRIKGRGLREVALDMLALARGGLQRRALRAANGADESVYLAPLEAIAETGRPLAVERLEAYNGRWGRSVDPSFEECVLL
ncbi:glutamate--cysteine ligase [Methylocystis bryophila]|uniref:Glutamate--cysteine ligase n=1 Tax=Methylocystis bryophila TaxID=655015 RepID=A0A1W6MX75_9HYPH|nr:glutamate--cysteine ligase [Methylocystis bryophila]ARN82198.1 glutamate--cysteine ligase [Methylocystis bryophila]BDV38329.1 glutamate--cysteine ligase [Methylocystis bryophila]